MFKKLLLIFVVIIIGGTVIATLLYLKEDNYCKDSSTNAKTEQIVFIPFKSNTIYGSGVVLTGCLQSGTLQSGMKTIINGKETRIKGAIEAYGGSYDSISSNINKPVGILLQGLTEDDKKATENMIKNKAKVIFIK